MPKYETTNWRVFGRMTRSSGTQGKEDDERSASTIKNAFYTIQADYSKFKGEYNPIDDGASLFRLGYVGKESLILTKTGSTLIHLLMGITTGYRYSSSFL